MVPGTKGPAYPQYDGYPVTCCRGFSGAKNFKVFPNFKTHEQLPVKTLKTSSSIISQNRPKSEHFLA